jgi:hypothetical protein
MVFYACARGEKPIHQEAVPWAPQQAGGQDGGFHNGTLIQASMHISEAKKTSRTA